MADNIAPFAFTTQEDWYGELTFRSAEDGSALSLAGRQFVMLVTPARSGAQIVEPAIELTMGQDGGLALKEGDPSTLVFRATRAKTRPLDRGEYTADILEVVSGERYLFMPVRINYAEPSGLRAFFSRFLGATVSFASRVQPIVTPVAVAGRQGARGAGYITGQGAPTAADGADGDYWIDASVAPRLIYGPKTGGVWPPEGDPFATDLTPEIEEARDLTLSARNEAAASRNDAATSRDEAQMAATKAEGAVAIAAAKAGQFATLAALRAISNPTVVTAAEVTADGANNGAYQFDPANAAAGWVLKSSDTVSGIAARLIPDARRASVTELASRGIKVGPEVSSGVTALGFAGKTKRLLAFVEPKTLAWVATRMRAARSMTIGTATTFVVPSSWNWGLTGGGKRIVVGLKGSLFHVTRLALPRSVQISSRDTDWSWAFTGGTGKPVIGFRLGDLWLGHIGRSADAKMLLREPGLVARAARVRAPVQARFARLTFDFNLILANGQSLTVAYEGWPRMSIVARPDCFMVGNSVRSAGEGAGTWAPVGGTAVLQPMVATVEDSAGAPISDAAAAALPVGDTARGEAPIVGAVNSLARSVADLRGPGRSFVAMTTGVSGRTIEQLSPGADPDYYSRVTSALSTFTSLVPAGKTGGCPGVLIFQGESNYDAAFGGVRTKDGYKTALAAYIAAVRASVMSATGQSYPPAIFIYQTDAKQTVGTDDVAIGMAQWELSREMAGVYLFAPVYPVTDKSTHLDNNGYRWMGEQAGKVMHRVVTLGEAWEPLAPVFVETIGRTIYVGYHVPAGRLAFDAPYIFAGPNTISVPNLIGKGFRVTDGAGAVGINSVRLLGSNIVAIECDRKPDKPTGALLYGGKNTANGFGFLHDTDETVALTDYTYSAGSGQYASQSRPELNGKPYPLWNWAVQHNLPLTWSR